MIKKEAIIIDLDGTLANCDHRRHLVEGEKRDWDRFFSLMWKDTANYIVWEFTQNPYATVLIVSGRPNKYRRTTVKWLKDNNITYNRLFMRKNGDYRKDDVVKQEIYDTKIKDKYDIKFAIDDREDIAEVWNRNGIPVLLFKLAK